MSTETRKFTVGDVIRMPGYQTQPGRFRCWKVVGVYLGGTNQEGSYELYPLDILRNKIINVPCLILETHPHIVKV